MHKLKRSLLHGVLFAVLAVLPVSALSAFQVRPAVDQQEPVKVEKVRGGVGFGFYYGRPYRGYRYYGRPYYRPYRYYRPYYYNRPYYYRWGW